MNKPIITTRGTNKAVKLVELIFMIYVALVAIIALAVIMERVDSYPSFIREKIVQEAAVPTIFYFALCMLVFLFGALQYASCRAYVDVFEDRMEGKGIQNLYQIVDFNLDYTKIINVTYVRNLVYINTSGGKYKIITNTKTAKEIFDYYNRECSK